jgi:rhodanese-related sulfurtransferase
MKTITVQQFKQLDHNKLLIIDVREPYEQTEIIPNAYSIPLHEITVTKLPFMDKPIILYCKAGIRSLDAGYKLLSENPQLDLYSLEGGIIAWQQDIYN